jgi:hypothetical protein
MATNSSRTEIVDAIFTQILPEVSAAMRAGIDRMTNMNSIQQLAPGCALSGFARQEIARSVTTSLHNGLRRVPCSQGVLLPFQDELGDELKQSIDSGEMGLVTLANGELPFSVKRLTTGESTAQDLARIQIPVGTLTPANGRRLNSIYDNTDYTTQTKGPAAEYIAADVLWDSISSPKAKNDPGAEQNPGTMRMSLVSAVLTTRVAGTKTIFPLQQYMHFNCTENNLGTVEGNSNQDPLSRKSTNRDHLTAAGELVIWSIANMWNATVHRLHNSPPVDTAAFRALSNIMYSDKDCRTTFAAISRICSVDSARAEKEADLFFAGTRGVVGHRTPVAMALLRPIGSVHEDTLNERYSLLETYTAERQARKAERLALNVSSVNGAPAESEPVRARDPRVVLRSPEDFKWATPRYAENHSTNRGGNRRPSSHDKSRQWRRSEKDQKRERY